MAALPEVRRDELKSQLLSEIVDPRGPGGVHLIMSKETLVQWVQRNLPKDDSALLPYLETANKVEEAVVHRAFRHAVQQGAQKMIDGVELEYECLCGSYNALEAIKGFVEAFQPEEKKTKQEVKACFISQKEQEDGFVEIDFIDRKMKRITDQTLQLLREWQRNPFSLLPKGEVLPYLKGKDFC